MPCGRSTEPLPPDQWLDLARRFVAALKSGGLVADWQQTTMQIAAPRLPGTFNWKIGEPRPVTITRLGGSLGRTRFVQALHRHAHAGSSRPTRRQIAVYRQDMAGITEPQLHCRLTEPVTPQDVAALFAVLPNTGIGYDRWVRIAFACWVVVYQSTTRTPSGSSTTPSSNGRSHIRARRGDRGWVDPEKTWKSTRKVRSIGDATFVVLARQIGFWLPSRVTSAASVFERGAPPHRHRDGCRAGRRGSSQAHPRPSSPRALPRPA